MERFAWWVTASGVAIAIGASQSYLTFGAGIPRLVVDGLIVGLLQSLALRGLVRFPYWVILTISALGLAIVAGLGTVVAAGSLFASTGNVGDFYVVLSYGFGAAVAGLVGGFVQGVVLPARRRLFPWLVASTCGAPFIFPALIFSWVPSGTGTAPLPAWAVGLLGGLVYGVISGIGLVRSLRPITSIA